MIKILQWLFRSDIAPYIAFKWGTLAYFHYNLDRYSTDIDLDLLDHRYEKEVMETIVALLSKVWEIKLYTLWKDLHRWIFRYDLQSTNIKVELNKRETSYNKYEIVPIHWVDMQCMDTKTMVTNKLLALRDRRYNRDVYDTWFFRIQHYEYDEQIIKARTGKSLIDIIKEIIELLPEQYSENTILGGMWDVLTDAQKPRVKSSLVTETIKLLQQYLSTH